MPELYDPFDPRIQEDPYPVYSVLRDEMPLYRNEERGFWVLSRFDDIWNATHDHQRFSSASGIMIGQDMMGDASALMPMMIMMDPPRHDELRKLVSRGFTPRRMAAMEERIRDTSRELLAEFVSQGEADLVRDYAAPLPTIVIAEMLGVPREDRLLFREWSDQLVQGNPDDPASVERAISGATSLYEYFGPLLAARRAHPEDDLISALLEAEVDGQKLAEEELLGFCFLLLVAGNETTTNLISNAAVLLCQHPEIRRQVTSDRDLLSVAVEEFLRLESPVQGLARTVTEDVEVRGQTLSAGDKVMLLFASANRDEREFDDPEAFVLGRRTERALAFGHGIHYCLGAALARLECRVAYEELLACAPDFALADGAQRLHSGPIRGYLHLPITFAPTRVSEHATA